jgi:histidinol phosphatase-like enzyme
MIFKNGCVTVAKKCQTFVVRFLGTTTMWLTRGLVNTQKRVTRMGYTLVVWPPQQIIGFSLWMREPVSVLKFMSAHQFSAQGTVLSDLCMAIYVWIITLSRKPKGGFKFYILHRT